MTERESPLTYRNTPCGKNRSGKGIRDEHNDDLIIGYAPTGIQATRLYTGRHDENMGSPHEGNYQITDSHVVVGLSHSSEDSWQ